MILPRVVSTSIERTYGRKAGLLRHYLHAARYRLGLLSYLEQVDWRVVNRLVFVCKGNICRSAYCEGKAKSLGIPATSFGLNVRELDPANEVAIRIAKSRGVDLTIHYTRSSLSSCAGDLLLAMEPWQAATLIKRGIPSGAKVSLLGLWCNPPRPHIEDPNGLSEDYFHTCFSSIDGALHRIAALMATTAKRDSR